MDLFAQTTDPIVSELIRIIIAIIVATIGGIA